MSANADDPSSRQPPRDPGAFSQEVQHAQVSAAFPEKVSRGVFSTGVLVLQSANEFILDFVQGMVQPRNVAARIVLPPSVVPSLVNALRDNLAMYRTQYGEPPALRQPTPAPPPPSTEEIYSQFKLADDLLSGVYANAALIVHTQSEFCLDFITTFYPRSAVSCRVYLTAAQAPALLNTLSQSFQQYQQKLAGQQGGQPPPPPHTN